MLDKSEQYDIKEVNLLSIPVYAYVSTYKSMRASMHTHTSVYMWTPESTSGTILHAYLSF